MRTIVDIPDAQIKILTQLSKKKKISRAEVIRRALTDYIESSNKITKIMRLPLVYGKIENWMEFITNKNLGMNGNNAGII